jgi:hypothetical protein
MLMVEIGSWTRDLCLGDLISLPLRHEVPLQFYLVYPMRWIDVDNIMQQKF